ncbi:hypothetical protein ASF61_20810 [Duganella sp. Leaf126]|uniref:NRDE family protein n=1 Tax=Duganella sp. Leaf126 TaxID=1736266 RepID=UPI0006FF9301|nr:NRDE family protein [Duganella sp. Leaf126]KQQ45078.1 hypothetical protein ASF61_20810 [Duganella sp. Leaf126]
MCLMVFAWKILPAVPLVAAANRDEFYGRATAAAAPWPDHPHIYGGRDLQAGGSWMGIAHGDAGGDRNGARFAAITNIRAPGERRDDAPSRGRLVADFLTGNLSPQAYIDTLRGRAADYNGFNLVVGDRDTLIWYSNRGDADPRNGQPLPPGVYGVSNALLDAPWPKVVKTKAELASLICLGAPDDAFFEMLADTTPAPDQRLPETGVPLDIERVLSSVRIDSPGYGTRTSTVVKLYANATATLQEHIFR